MPTPFLDHCSGSLLKISAGSADSSGYLMNPEILDEQHNIKSSISIRTVLIQASRVNVGVPERLQGATFVSDELCDVCQL